VSSLTHVWRYPFSRVMNRRYSAGSGAHGV
jgi:hypothetical protein